MVNIERNCTTHEYHYDVISTATEVIAAVGDEKPALPTQLSKVLG